MHLRLWTRAHFGYKSCSWTSITENTIHSHRDWWSILLCSILCLFKARVEKLVISQCRFTFLLQIGHFSEMFPTSAVHAFAPEETIKTPPKKKWICPICDKALAHRESMPRHIRLHKLEYKHHCEVCGKGFMDKWALKGHMTKHTNEKPYSCHLCDAKYAYKHIFKNHLWVKHGVRASVREISWKCHFVPLPDYRNQQEHAKGLPEHSGNLIDVCKIDVPANLGRSTCYIAWIISSMLWQIRWTAVAAVIRFFKLYSQVLLGRS